MKKTLLLLSVAGMFALPALTRAQTPATKGKPATRTAAVQPVKARPHVIYYITDTPRTGSAIPMMYRSYNNRIDAASNPAVYGQSSIAATGAIDVGTALYRLDPSISFSHR